MAFLLFLIFILSFLSPPSLEGQSATLHRYTGQCKPDTVDVLINPSATSLITNACQVDIYATGTVSSSSICSDSLDPCTVKANPFTADSDGVFFFYAVTGVYDVKTSSGTPNVVTRTEVGVELGVSDLINELTISKKLYDIRTYGATADDDSDDDLSEIQAAIDAATAAGGGVVFIPEGVFDVVPIGVSTCITMKSNVSVVGEGDSSKVRVKSAAGTYNAVFCDTSGVTNITFANFEIDTNIANNLGTVTAGNGFRQTAIQLFNSSNIRILRMHILYSGVHGMSATGSAIEDVWISGNRLEYVRDTGIAGIDNTGIYTDANRVMVDNNTLVGVRVPFSLSSTPNGSSIGCMEAHAGPTTFSNNHCKDYVNCQHSVSYSGSNLGPYPTSNLITHVGNTCEDGSNCHLIASIDSRELNGVVIVGNTCNLLQNTWNQNSSTGINLLNLVSAGIDGSFRDVVISGNSIHFQDEGVGRASLSDSAMCGICLDPQGSVTNVLVSDNIITNAPSMGIKVGNLNSAADEEYRNIVIRDNLLVDYGQNKLNSFFRMGIRTEGDLIGLVIEDNTFIHTSTDELEVPAINMVTASAPNKTSYRNCIIRGNEGAEFSTFDTASPCEYEPEERFVKYSATFSGAPLTPTVNGTYRLGEIVGNTTAAVDGYSIRMHVVTAAGSVRTIVGSPTCTSGAGSTTTVATDASEFMVHDIIQCGACSERKEILKIIDNTVLTDISSGGACSGNFVLATVTTRPGGLLQTVQPVLTSAPYTVGVMTGGEGVPSFTTGTAMVVRANAAAGNPAFLAILGGTTGQAGIDLGSQAAAAGAQVIYFPVSDVIVVNNQLVSLGPNTSSVPESSVEAFGSFGVPLKFITNGDSPYTAAQVDHTLSADASGGAITVDLPAAADVKNRMYAIYKTDSSGNNVTIDPDGAEGINAVATLVLSAQHAGAIIQSDGVGWRILATQP